MPENSREPTCYEVFLGYAQVIVLSIYSTIHDAPFNFSKLRELSGGLKLGSLSHYICFHIKVTFELMYSIGNLRLSTII